MRLSGDRSPRTFPVCAKSSDEDMQVVQARLQSAGEILLLTHARPDGDALGSMSALARSAEAVGKKCAAICPEKPPRRYEFLLQGLRIASLEDFSDLAERSDCIAVLDTSSQSQLPGLAEALRQVREKTVVIDHHQNPDKLADVQWIDQSAAAVGVMLAELIDSLAWPVPTGALEALATAILTDTGWLSYANTDVRTLRAVAKLVSAGVRPDGLYRRLYQNDRPQRAKLKARLLEGLSLQCDGKLAVMTLTCEDFAKSDADLSETEDLVNEAMNIATVELATLFVEEKGQIRASLRSRGHVDVSLIARNFGGGGHAKAAGCRSESSLAAFRDALVRACTDALG